MNYKEAGVDIAAGEQLVHKIKPIAARTRRPEVLAGIGGFSALFELPWQRYRQPVLVSATDGVGTKLKLALALQQHETVGIDLVAMCVNDLVVCGAEPLFFLDYYATAKLNVDVATAVVRGIGQGCEQAGAALVGGETAEMPGMYATGDYDLAGFCVGIVEKTQIIDGQSCQPGDVLLGLASSGLHSNGYSLVRALLAQKNISLTHPFAATTLGEVLLRPTRIYVKALLNLFKTVPVKMLAHITGGGLLENIPRVLPPYTQALIRKNAWPRLEIFNWLQTEGNLADEEMYRTFNCGIGMVIAVSAQQAAPAQQLLTAAGETCWIIGEIAAAATEKPQVVIT